MVLAKKIWNHFLNLTLKLRWLPPTLTRISVGLLFVSTGWGKVTHIDNVVDFFTSLGIPAASFQAHLVAFSELGCGLLLLVGLATRLASIPLIVIMSVALMTARLEDIHEIFDLFGEAEYLFILLLIYLAVDGPGPLSLDRILKKKLAS